MSKTINVKFVGCRLNQFESDYIKSTFTSEGYTSVDKNADICIVNTCTVTNSGDSKSRKAIRRLIKKNPEAVIAVMGCYSQLSADEVFFMVKKVTPN